MLWGRLGWMEKVNQYLSKNAIRTELAKRMLLKIISREIKTTGEDSNKETS